MFGVKQLFILSVFAISFAINFALVLPSYAQEIDVQEIDIQETDISTSVVEPIFTFEMPPEYQTELPQDKAKLAPKPIKKPLFDLGFLGPIFQLIFYGILGLAVIYILYLILNTIIATRRAVVRTDKTEDIPDIPIYQPDADTARVLINDADGLAAQGKFAEAVHILLFRSIQDIEDKRPHHVKRSLTSREIASLSILSPKARDVFSQIGKLVEKSFFGGGILSMADYELSKAAYQAFAFENVAQSRSKAKSMRSARERR